MKHFNDKIILKNLKNKFLNWRNNSREINQNGNKEICVNSNFFDSCLSLNKENKSEKNDTNKDENSSFNITNKKNENKIIQSDNEECNVIINDNKTVDKSFDFEENIFPKYNNNNNNSIIINDNNNSHNSNTSKNEMNNNNCYNEKIHEEELIINYKDNSKTKSDIFDSSDINDVNDINDDCLNIDIKNINIENNSFISGDKEKNNDNSQNNDIDNKIDINNNTNSKLEINEICNLFNNEKDDNLNNSNDNKIFNENKINEINEEKNELGNGQGIIKNNTKKSRNDISLKDMNQRNFVNVEKEGEDNNNKNINFFDSLEYNNFGENKTDCYDYYIKNEFESNTKMNKIQNNKIKILNQFLTLEKESSIKKSNTSKKRKFQISQAHNIFLNKVNKEKEKENEKSNASFFCTQTKVENIFIKGEKGRDNNSLFKTENKTKKNLELFIIDKNDNIFIKHNTNKNNQKKVIDNFNCILDNNNNIQERVINSKMIINFLNNSKNEPMFPILKNYSTIQAYHNKSKNNILINNPKSNNENKTKNKNKNINFKKFKNFLNERKNHFYLKKPLVNIENDNNNENVHNGKANSLIDFNIKENELIEPNVQVCPVSNSNINTNNKKLNDMYEKLSNGNAVENILIKKKKKSASKTNKRMSKNLSSYFANNKSFNKYNTFEQNDKMKNRKKNNSISNELIQFIDFAKKNKENTIRNYDKGSGDIYNFKTLKYDKINTYRENYNKKKEMNKTNNKSSKSSLINDSYDKIRNNKGSLNKTLKKNSTNNINNVKNLKKRNVDYKRLDKLYLDYKIKNVKRDQLKKDHDIKAGITFIPLTNKTKIKISKN